MLLFCGMMIHSGGDIINDIYDRHIDKICKPNSPIVSGRMSVRTAWVYLGILYLTAILIASLLNYICAGLSILGIIIGGFLYSHPKYRVKDHPVFSIASCALCFALEPIAIWSIYAPVTIDTLLISFYVFTLTFSLIFFKDFRDVKGDSNSLPLMLGVKKAARFVCVLSLLPVLPMIFLFFLYKTVGLILAIIVYGLIAISAIHILLNDPVTHGNKLKNRMFLMIFAPSFTLFLMTFFF
ncbi:MAG: ubiquinone biosynthesis protein UbiA [Candidatus Altiarchaeales archaeon HGW-Altiarchaeales-3]|nr:MAG: ubiquinone biosynthesis protein UbiA [Candidatus Altiarchaeales archaeon HGW-Altiarchaeales-3]